MFTGMLDRLPYPQLMAELIDRSGYGPALKEEAEQSLTSDGKQEAKGRLENLEQLLAGMEEHAASEGSLQDYLEQVAPEESLWEGDCFVLDNRVTVDHELREGDVVWFVLDPAHEGAARLRDEIRRLTSMRPDELYVAAGATIVPDAATGYGSADLVFKLNPPTPDEIAQMREGTTLVSFINALTDKAIVDALNARKISAIAMELVPRITRAQKMDALSSQANLAGYKAVIMAAEYLPKIFPMLMTAAGTIQPARVVIMGAGVAGLQAIATAKRLGAVVEVSDVRPAVKEQVESLGGKFIEVPTDESAEDEGGYAKEQSEEFLQKQRELVREKIVHADVVITTAAIPGKPAPKLVTDDMVEEMRPGSVIVDLAAEGGGNCELTKADEVVEVDNVKIFGPTNLPGEAPYHASQMYAKNIATFLLHLVDEGNLKIDTEDEITEGTLITQGGKVVNTRVLEAMGASIVIEDGYIRARADRLEGADPGGTWTETSVAPSSGAAFDAAQQ